MRVPDLIGERDAHVWVVDHHVAGDRLWNRDGVWRRDDCLFDVPVRAAVEHIRAAKLKYVDVGDGR